MINRIVLVGRLTKDPELKYTQSGIATLRFTLAVNRPFQDNQGNRQADFINCVAWRAQAENLAKFQRKGALLGVEGRIETGSYQKDGVTRYTTDVVAEHIAYLEPKTNNQQTNQAMQEAGWGPAPTNQQPPQNPIPYSPPFPPAQASPGALWQPGQPVPDDYVPGGNQPSRPLNVSDDDLPF